MMTTDDYGLDGFTANPESVAAMTRRTGLVLKDTIRLTFPEGHPAHTNLDGHRGKVVGTNLFDPGLVAVALDEHPGQRACYATPSTFSRAG